MADPTPLRDAKGQFLARTPPPPDAAQARDRELLERIVWLLERLLWQGSGSMKPFAQYRQQLRQEAPRDA